MTTPDKRSHLDVRVEVKVSIPGALQPGDSMLLKFVSEGEDGDGAIIWPSEVEAKRMVVGSLPPSHRPLVLPVSNRGAFASPAQNPPTEEEYEEALRCTEDGYGSGLFRECQWHEEVADRYEDALDYPDTCPLGGFPPITEGNGECSR